MKTYTLILFGLCLILSVIVAIWGGCRPRYFFKEFDFTRAKSDELRNRGPLV